MTTATSTNLQFSCLQENLSSALTQVARAAAKRTTLPITMNVLIESDQGRLKLTCTDLQKSTTRWIGADISSEGAITIPANPLREFVTALPAGRVDLEVNGNTLRLTSGKSVVNINGENAEDFPPVPQVGEGAWQIDPATLATAIDRVQMAAAREDSRPVLTGIRFEIEGDKLTLATADGFRLAVSEAKLIEAGEDSSFIVPVLSMIEVARLARGQEEPVRFGINGERKSAVAFHLDNIEFTSQLIQGTYPNYRQLIPDKHSTRVVVDAEALERAMKLVSVMARDGSGVVRLQASVDEGKLFVSGRAEEQGDASSEVEAQVEGENGRIAFNTKYPLELLSVVPKSEKMWMEMTAPSSPALLGITGDESYKHVIMPFFVQW